MAKLAEKIATQTMQVAKAGGRKAAAPGALWFPILGYLALVAVGFFLGTGIEKWIIPLAGAIGVGLFKFFSSPSKENEREQFFKK